MQLVSFKSVLKLRKNTNCMTPGFKRDPKNTTFHVYKKPMSEPCKSPKKQKEASNMAILKCALIVVFCLSFTHASRSPPAPKLEESLESMSALSRKLDEAKGDKGMEMGSSVPIGGNESASPKKSDEAEGAKGKKVGPSSGVGVGYGSGTGTDSGTGVGYGSGSGSGSGGDSGYGYGRGSGSGNGGSGTGVGYGLGSGSGYGYGSGSSGSDSGYGYGSGSGSGNGGSGTGVGYGSGSGSSSGSGYGYGSGSGPGYGGSGSGVGVGIGVGQGGGNNGYPGNPGYWDHSGCPPYQGRPCNWPNDPNCGGIISIPQPPILIPPVIPLPPTLIPPPICVPGVGCNTPTPYSNGHAQSMHEDHQPTSEAGKTRGQAVDKKPMHENGDPSAERDRPHNEAQVGSGQSRDPQVQL